MNLRPYQVSDFCGRFRATIIFAAILAFASVARGQDASSDDAIEGLRKRPPSGGADDQIIEDWLAREFDKLSNAADKTAAGRLFLEEIDRVRNAPDTLPRFAEVFTARLGTSVGARLKEKPPIQTESAETMVLALINANDQRTAPGLTAALSFPAVSIRYLGARGLRKIRDTLTSAPNGQLRAVVQSLGNSGANETNAVVVERIYGALSFGTPDAEVFAAIAKVLKARVDRYRRGVFPADLAEPALLDYLSARQIPPPQAAPIIRELATLLRLDVDHYGREELKPADADFVDRRIDMCEMAIQRITGLSGGDVRGMMKRGDVGVAPSMKLELYKWVGTPGQAGVLNSAPWSVPSGAP